jgi:hypothetical protein
MRSWALVLGVSAFAVFLAGTVSAEEKAAKGKSSEEKTSKKKEKQVPWAVIKVGDELRIVQQDKIKEIQADLDKEAKDAKKKGKKIETKLITKLKEGFATQKDAEKYRDKWIEDHKKKDSSTEKAGHAKAGHGKAGNGE